MTESSTSNPRLPTLALYSRCGAIPYLNWNFVAQNNGIICRDNDGNAVDSKDILLINIADLATLQSAGSLEAVSGMKYLQNFEIMTTIFEQLGRYQNFKSTETAVPVTTTQGKELITVERLFKIVSEMNPSSFQSIADINVPQIAGKKWSQKASSRTNRFLEQVLEHRKAEAEKGEDKTKKIKLERPKVWASLSGGFSVRDRQEGCKVITQHAGELDGVVIEGFYGYNTKPREWNSGKSSVNNNEVNGKEKDEKEPEKEVEEAYFADNYQDCADLLEKTILPALPTSLPRALFGAFYPDDILRLIALDINLLDSSICTLLTQSALALPSPLVDLAAPKLNFCRPEVTFADSKENKVDFTEPIPGSMVLLSEPKYKDSKELISASCQCYTCSAGFSRAYLNHLYKRNELNGPMLLQIHNHYVFTQFFCDLRTIIREGRFGDLLKNSSTEF